MSTADIPTTDDLRRIWLVYRMEDPTMRHDPDGSDADDGFQVYYADLRRRAKAEGLREALDAAGFYYHGADIPRSFLHERAARLDAGSTE